MKWTEIKSLVSGSEMKQLTGQMGRHKPFYLAGLLGSSIINASSSVIMAFILQYLIDAAGEKSMNLLVRALVIASAMCVGLCLFTPIFEFLFNAGIKRCMADIRGRVFGHVESLSVDYFEGVHSGDILSRMNNDVQVMEQCYGEQFRMVVVCAIYGTASAACMIALEWRISLGLIALGLVTMFVNSRFAGPIRRISDKIQEQTAAMLEKVSDLLAGFQTVKIFKLGELLLGNYAASNETVAKSSIKRAKINAWLDSSNFLLVWLNFGGVMAVGSLLAINGQISFGKLVAVVQLLNGVVFMFQNLGSFLAKFQASLAGAGRVFELLTEEPESWGETEKLSVVRTDGITGIDLKQVSFSYGENKNILEDFSLSVEGGKVAALVGPSGGGKSTVFKLLLGFHPIAEGKAALDGRNLNDYSLKELRGKIAYVSQDNYLFNVSIRENILYGKPGATQEEVEEAARLAFAHEFILEQPEGYDTIVGENGSALSGGQKQRIAIARAFLKNAPVLLLDEATSALDSRSEELVREALDTLMKGRTVVIIAHRLSTVEHADVICVVDQGRVAEKGTHAELLESGGLYRKLYDLQFQAG